MKLGQKYKIEKPKVEYTRLNAEGLGQIMFGESVNQEGIFSDIKDKIKKWFKEKYDNWERSKPINQPQNRLTKEGKDKLKKLLETKQKELNRLLTSKKMVKHVLLETIKFGPVTYDTLPDKELFNMMSEDKYDINYLPTELLWLCQYGDVIPTNDSFDFMDFNNAIEKAGFVCEGAASSMESGIIGINVDHSLFIKDKDYFIYDPLKGDKNENK